MQDYRKLRVWLLAHELVLGVYAATRTFPIEERYGLQSQLRRAAVSVPTNIAEWAGRGSPGDFRRFQFISSGSVSEVSYLLKLASDLGFMQPEASDQLSDQSREVMKMIRGLAKKLETSSAPTNNE